MHVTHLTMSLFLILNLCKESHFHMMLWQLATSLQHIGREETKTRLHLALDLVSQRLQRGGFHLLLRPANTQTLLLVRLGNLLYARC